MIKYFLRDIEKNEKKMSFFQSFEKSPVSMSNYQLNNSSKSDISDQNEHSKKICLNQANDNEK